MQGLPFAATWLKDIYILEDNSNPAHRTCIEKEKEKRSKMDVISIIATVAAVALFIWFTVVWIKKGFIKSLLYLILSFAVLFLAIYFKTEDSEMTSRFIIGFPSVFMTIGGIFCTLGGEDAQGRLTGLKIIAVSIVLFLVLGLFGMNMSWTSSHSYEGGGSSNNDKDGFYGSDGEYHAYVPEFGDDVNNWMEENW